MTASLDQPGATTEARTGAPIATTDRVRAAAGPRARAWAARRIPRASVPSGRLAAAVSIAIVTMIAGPGKAAEALDQAPPRPAPQVALTATELAEVAAARVSPHTERPESAEVTPEAMAAAKEILEHLMSQLDFDVRVEIKAGETNRLNVVGEGDEKESLGALIGRKGERLSALQHLVNLLLSKRVGEWTRILVDVEDYRGRRERQLRDLANRAAERVVETGKMLQLEPMPALERRWIHLALRDHERVATQSIGEEPNRRVVVLPRDI